MPTAVSPVRSTSQPLSQEAGLSYMDLSGPSYSSTQANQQRGSGARPFSSPSPVPSTSTSSKRARLDDSAEVNLRLYLNSSANTSCPSPYDKILDDDALGPAGDLSGSQLRRRDLQGYLQPALKARMDKYIQERVADAVERAVATIEGKVEALQSRVDQLETALKQKEPVTPRCQKVDKEVSVSTYFIKLVSVKLSRKIFICCNVSPFLVVNICDTTEKKIKYMSYKIKIQCLVLWIIIVSYI